MDLKCLGPIAQEPSRRAAGSVSAYCRDSHYLEMLQYSPESSLNTDFHLQKSQLSGILCGKR